MTEKQFTATVKATDPKGEATYITKTGDTLENAQKAAVRWGVAYYLYDNRHITGEHSAQIASEQAGKMLREGGLEYDGFIFELIETPVLEAA